MRVIRETIIAMCWVDEKRAAQDHEGVLQRQAAGGASRVNLSSVTELQSIERDA